MNQPYKKIFICVTGSGSQKVKELLKEKGISVSNYNELSKEEVKECFNSKKILSDNPKTEKRLEFIINETKNVNHKMLKNYNILLLVENKGTIPNDPILIDLKNQSDYYLDYQTLNGECMCQTFLKKSLDQLIDTLIKNMR